MPCRWWFSFRIADDRVADFTYRGPWWVADVPGPDSVICAAVIAESLESAEAMLRASFSGEVPSLTFEIRERKPDTWEPFRARFPRIEGVEWP